MRTSLIATLTLSLLLGTVAVGENVDRNGDNGGQYAWTENHGWINVEPSGNGGPGLQIDDFAVTGWMWGENLGWISASCQNTASCGTNAYGVTNDGSGNLSGYAWAEHGGWISFSCENTGSCAGSPYGVTVDAVTGELSGFAFGENTGWISFSCEATGSCGAVAYGVDTSWCEGVAGPPPSANGLVLGPGSIDGDLSWQPVAGAAWYEIVSGSLGVLRSTGGDFAAATDFCLADNVTTTSYHYIGLPAPGEGQFLLVRGANCRGGGSYDSGGAGQTAPRDAGIAASGADCP